MFQDIKSLGDQLCNKPPFVPRKVLCTSFLLAFRMGTCFEHTYILKFGTTNFCFIYFQPFCTLRYLLNFSQKFLTSTSNENSISVMFSNFTCKDQHDVSHHGNKVHVAPILYKFYTSNYYDTVLGLSRNAILIKFSFCLGHT